MIIFKQLCDDAELLRLFQTHPEMRKITKRAEDRCTHHQNQRRSSTSPTPAIEGYIVPELT